MMGLLDYTAMDPKMQRTQLPSPMGLKPMMQGADLQRGMTPPASPGMSMDMRRALSQTGQALASQPLSVQSMAQAATPLLDMWQKKRQAAGQSGILSGLLGR